MCLTSLGFHRQPIGLPLVCQRQYLTPTGQELIHVDCFTCTAVSTCDTQHPCKKNKQKKQPSISLSHDSRGQYILINVFHYYAYVFIFLMMDLVRRKPCIFVDKAVRQHQAIKNYTSHACLHPKLNNISKTLSIQINHMICVWLTDKWRRDMTANKAD